MLFLVYKTQRQIFLLFPLPILSLLKKYIFFSLISVLPCAFFSFAISHIIIFFIDAHFFHFVFKFRGKWSRFLLSTWGALLLFDTLNFPLLSFWFYPIIIFTILICIKICLILFSIKSLRLLWNIIECSNSFLRFYLVRIQHISEKLQLLFMPLQLIYIRFYRIFFKVIFSKIF